MLLKNDAMYEYKYVQIKNIYYVNYWQTKTLDYLCINQTSLKTSGSKGVLLAQ